MRSTLVFLLLGAAITVADAFPWLAGVFVLSGVIVANFQGRTEA